MVSCCLPGLLAWGFLFLACGNRASRIFKFWYDFHVLVCGTQDLACLPRSGACPGRLGGHSKIESYSNGSKVSPPNQVFSDLRRRIRTWMTVKNLCLLVSSGIPSGISECIGHLVSKTHSGSPSLGKASLFFGIDFLKIAWHFLDRHFQRAPHGIEIRDILKNNLLKQRDGCPILSARVRKNECIRCFFW